MYRCLCDHHRQWQVKHKYGHCSGTGAEWGSRYKVANKMKIRSFNESVSSSSWKAKTWSEVHTDVVHECKHLPMGGHQFLVWLFAKCITSFAVKIDIFGASCGRAATKNFNMSGCGGRMTNLLSAYKLGEGGLTSTPFFSHLRELQSTQSWKLASKKMKNCCLWKSISVIFASKWYVSWTG